MKKELSVDDIDMAWSFVREELGEVTGHRAKHLLAGLKRVEAQCRAEQRPLPSDVHIAGLVVPVDVDMLSTLNKRDGIDNALLEFAYSPVVTAMSPTVREQAPKAAEVRPAAPTKGEPVLAPVPVSVAQEFELLRAIQEAGYNPKALPPRVASKRGVKAELRAKLKDHRLFVGEKKFDKAWERLRASGDIGDSSSPALG